MAGFTPEVTEAGAVVPLGSTLSPNDIYYLRSIYTQLEGVLNDFRKRSYGVTLGGEILADNLDWLDCFIEQHNAALLLAVGGEGDNG